MWSCISHAGGVGQLVHMSSVGTYAPGRYGERVNESWPTTGIESSAYSRDIPLDRRLSIPLVHADDVAEAISRVIERRATGPFNLAAEPPVGRDDVAAAFDARSVHIPSGLLGVLVDLSWRARLQHIDRGWLDLAFTVPQLDSSRAHSELGWTPKWSSKEVLADFLDGVAHQAHAASAPLRPRSMLELLRRDVTEGFISSRRLP